ncbi:MULTISPECIES: hypothetical protein [Protofrankia]|uniref:hypothetical protein n=1 Tax=Protofrankia TaxID=2994361 RepID=UPI0010416868|nr:MULTISPECIES: hypothetical protein [Protofrankia]
MSVTGAGRRPSRRGVLGALPLAATAVLAGRSWNRSAYGPGEPSGPDTVDSALFEAATRSEQGLLVAYDQAIRTHPAIAATLTVLRAHHVEHVGRLGSAATGGGLTIASGLPGIPRAPGAFGSATARPTTAQLATADQATPQRSAVSQQVTVAALVQLEQQAAALLRTRCLTAAAAVVPLLASIHAAELAHADLLTQLAR